MCKCEPTVLLVDDERPVLDSNRDYLEANGYRVFAVQTAEEALHCCDREIIHLAVIDVRLRDDRDPDDWSGVQELARSMTSSIPRIFLTAYGEDPARVRDALLPDENLRFVWKVEGPDKLIEEIKAAFDNHVHLNTNLDIRFPRGVKWRTLVEGLRQFTDASNDEKEKAERILEDLTCRLFHKASRVQFLRLTPGDSSCTVALVRPFYDNNAGTELAVKYALKHSIARENTNCERWVKPYAGIRSTQLQEGPVWSREMGAIAYTFVGTDAESVEDFASYYKKSSVRDNQVADSIEDLFANSCKKWYDATRSPNDAERKPLDVWYREQLNFVDAEDVDRLRKTLRHLLESTVARTHGFQLLDGGLIQVRIGDSKPLTLPNPVQFVFGDNGSAGGRDCFPVPSRVAITHGDFHGGNILVGERGNTWLIEFYRTGWGPALRDFVTLESEIKFDLIGRESLSARYNLDRALLSSNGLNDRLFLDVEPSAKQIRAMSAIQRLREMAFQLTDTEGMTEYYVGLLFSALKRLDSGSIESLAGTESPKLVPKYHALLSAAMICERLALGDRFPSWRPQVAAEFFDKPRTTATADAFFKKAGFATRAFRTDLVVSNSASAEWEPCGDMFIKCLLQGEKADKRDVVEMEKESLALRENGNWVGFLVHSEGLAKGAPRQIWKAKKKGVVVIPLYVPKMLQAIESGDPDECYSQVSDLKHTWGMMTDPYERVDATSDPQWFVGRTSMINDIMAQIKGGGKPVLVFGMRRSGKTALLNQIELKCRSAGFPTSHWMAKRDVGFEVLLYNFISDLNESIRRMYPKAALSRRREVKDYQDNPTASFKADLQETYEAVELNSKRGASGSRARLVLLLDELDIKHFFPWKEDKDEHYQEFSNLFQAIKEVTEVSSHPSLSLIVAAEQDWIDGTNRYPWNDRFQNPMFSRFFRMPLDLLTRNDVGQMAKLLGELAGLEYTEESLDRIYAETGGHPHVTRWLCSCVWRLRERRGFKGKVGLRVVDSAVKLLLFEAEGETYRNHFENVFWWNDLSPDIGSDQRAQLELASNQLTLEGPCLEKESAPNSTISEAIDRLINLGIVRRSDRNEMQGYELTIALYARWIRSEKLGIAES